MAKKLLGFKGQKKYLAFLKAPSLKLFLPMCKHLQRVNLCKVSGFSKQYFFCSLNPTSLM
jgi:hypothetical protein